MNLIFEQWKGKLVAQLLGRRLRVKGQRHERRRLVMMVVVSTMMVRCNSAPRARERRRIIGKGLVESFFGQILVEQTDESCSPLNCLQLSSLCSIWNLPHFTKKTQIYLKTPFLTRATRHPNHPSNARLHKRESRTFGKNEKIFIFKFESNL